MPDSARTSNSTATADIIPQKKTLRPEAEKIWRLHTRFYDAADDKTTPVAIWVPGFRALSIRHERNKKIYNELARRGIPQLAFNYSGCRNFKKVNEDATFETHVEDVKDVIASLGDRPHFLISESYGINVALAAANEKTMGLISVVPAPDIVAKKLIPKIESLSILRKAAFNAAMTAFGFFCSKKPPGANSGVPFIKLTKAFLESAKQEIAQVAHLVTRVNWGLPVDLVINNEDEFSKELGAFDLQQIFTKQGLPTTMTLASSNLHDIAEDTINKTIHAALELIRAGNKESAPETTETANATGLIFPELATA